MEKFIEFTKNKITYDNVTGRVNGTRDIEGMCLDIHELLNVYWPKWTGEFNPEYPSNTDAKAIPDEIITSKTLELRPLKTDTSFARNNTPDTKLKYGGMVAPRLMDYQHINGSTDVKAIYSNYYEADVRFVFYAKTNKAVYKLAMNFMKFMRSVRSKLISRGLQNVWFQRYSENEKIDDVWSETLRTGVMDFYVQYQDVWTELNPTLGAVQLMSVANNTNELSEIENKDFSILNILGNNNGIKNPIEKESA